MLKSGFWQGIRKYAEIGFWQEIHSMVMERHTLTKHSFADILSIERTNIFIIQGGGGRSRENIRESKQQAGRAGGRVLCISGLPAREKDRGRANRGT